METKTIYRRTTKSRIKVDISDFDLRSITQTVSPVGNKDVRVLVQTIRKEDTKHVRLPFTDFVFL